MSPPPTFVLKKITWKVQKSKCENNIKWGPKRRKMMRGFQIWPQNSNRITFHPHFAQKAVKNWQNTRFSLFLTVFWSKRGTNVTLYEFLGQIWNNHSASLRTPHDMIFSFWFFDILRYFLTQMWAGVAIFWENVNFDQLLIVISVKKCIR